MLADIRYWENDATNKHYAIAHFNVWNAEMLMGVIDAAEEAKSPVIISFGTGFVGNTSFEDFSHMMVSMAQKATVPVITHWDHGRSMEIIHNAWTHGMNSLMRDASAFDFEENIRLTKEAVDFFHPLGIPVEAELGHVGNETVYEEALAGYHYTDPDQAAEFVERTGCDSLAVAIGNQHGVYTSEPQLNFEVVKRVRDAVSVPLVLHGASGISDADIKTAISLGIAKINIHTELCQAAMVAVKENQDQPFLHLEREVRKAVKERALEKSNQEYIKLLEEEKKHTAIIEKLTQELRNELDWFSVSIPGGVKISNDDPTYSFKYVSEQFANMLGYNTPEELIEAGQGSILGLAHPEDIMRGLADALDQYTRSDHYATIYRIRCKDGTYKYIEDRGQKVCKP